MAHFAQLNEKNQVIQVIVVDNKELMVDGVESEAKGIAFCQNLFGGNWKQTSYNSNFRKCFAGIGFVYDPIADEFNPPSEITTAITETTLTSNNDIITITEPQVLPVVKPEVHDGVVFVAQTPSEIVVNTSASDTISL